MVATVGTDLFARNESDEDRLNMRDVLISVIIPAYNAESQIQKCVESVCVAASGRDDIEILIIDDGSTDNTIKIVEKIINSCVCNIKVLSKENGGVSSARNVGIENATGRWIIFVDADDVLYQNAFSVIAECLNEYKSSDNILLTYSYDIVDKKQSQTIYLQAAPINVRSLLNGDCKSNSVFETTLCTVWNKVYDSRLLNYHRIRFMENIRIGEDMIFNSTYFQHVKLISFIPVALYRYNDMDGSAMTKFYKDYDRFILAMGDAYSELLHTLNFENPRSNTIKNRFIADRWLYATKMCITSSMGLNAKVCILSKWNQEIDDVLRTTILKYTSNRYSVIASRHDSIFKLYLCVIQLLIWNYLDRLKKGLYQIKAKLQ